MVDVRTQHGPAMGKKNQKNRHRPAPFYGDRAKCLESCPEGDDSLPGIDSCCTVSSEAVTPKLTMIAGRQLSIGNAHGGERPSRFNPSRRKWAGEASRAGSA